MARVQVRRRCRCWPRTRACRRLATLRRPRFGGHRVEYTNLSPAGRERFSRACGTYAALAWQRCSEPLAPRVRARGAQVATAECSPGFRIRAGHCSAAVLILTGAVGLDALSDPDVWWHIRLGDWIIAHHQIPAGELFAYTAFGNPLVAHEWLVGDDLRRARGSWRTVPRHRAHGPCGMERDGRDLLRGRLRGAGPMVLAVGLALGARAAEPVLGTRPQVFTFALVCWTLWIAESYLRSGGRRLWLLPPLFLLWANLHAGFIAGIGFLADRGRRRDDQAPVVARHGRSRAAHQAPRRRARRLGARRVRQPVRAVALRLRGNDRGDRASEGHHRVAVAELRGSDDVGAAGAAAHLRGAHGHGARAASLRRHFDLRDFALAAVGAGLALTSVRNTAICVAVMIPPWMAMAAGVVRSIEARRAQRAGGRAIAADGAR